MTVAHADHSATHTDASEPITFTYDGRTITAEPGQNIGAALYAAGQRIFSRSFKYHRPRGLFCVSGDCPNCQMEVDGRPNVRTCIEPARTGMVVRHQNAWPSLHLDVLSIFDRLDRFLPVGFYYKQFHKPRWLWPIFEHTVRHIAGIGRVNVEKAGKHDAEIEYIHTDVCVVGGGPAGVAAAAEAASAGARVLLLERSASLGGHLLFQADDLRPLDPLLSALRDATRVRVITEATAFGLYEGNLIGAFQAGRFLKIRARQIIICTGGRQRPLIFHNNDLPGIFLSSGVQRLGRLHHVAAGRRAVILADHVDARLVADLRQQGIEVAAIVQFPDVAPMANQNWGTDAKVHPASTVLMAHGRSHLSGVTVAEVRNGSVVAATSKDIACDLLCVASSLLPANELLLQGGVKYRHENGRWLMDRVVAGLSAAGAAAGTFDLEAQILEGRLRGLEAAASVGHTSSALEYCRQQWHSRAYHSVPPGSCILPSHAGSKRFVCLCEDVTEKDIDMAVAEGFDEIETLKRYSTVNMGPCQGKMCGHAAIELCARATGRDVGSVGMTTSRPPLVPVEMRILAAGGSHPVRRTPLHHWHADAGARWLDAGQWKRPESYGDVVGEVHAIRNAVGLIDVSTLGKIEVIGPDAVELLERVYINRWSDLKEGRTRYGVMCTEEGIVFDDGVVARLAPQHFYLTASSGNAEAVVRWLELWQTTWQLKATVLNRTGAFAAMNIAGPQARESLRKLTTLDLSPAAFPYLGFRTAEVAGVPCRLLRVGFVGELGYEVHCPAAQGLHVWEALCKAGKEFGIRPCGIEAQRILRLEKGHFIVTVDTDALSNPMEAGLESMIRFDKPIFHGREPLVRLRKMGPRSSLVGFVMEEENLVPSEGCQVVEQGKPVGRVTSARYSPTLERSLGLAWVPISTSRPGQRFFIRFSGSDVSARVVRLPFYDMEGKRLKS